MVIPFESVRAALRPSISELRFSVGDYFVGSGQLAASPFFDVVPVWFSVAEAEGQYHIPLRITPWTYTVYRGQ
jgi:5-hydroxyisourate hydrolase-like protein (transthyretin family)